MFLFLFLFLSQSLPRFQWRGWFSNGRRTKGVGESLGMIFCKPEKARDQAKWRESEKEGVQHATASKREGGKRLGKGEVIQLPKMNEWACNGTRRNHSERVNKENLGVRMQMEHLDWAIGAKTCNSSQKNRSWVSNRSQGKELVQNVDGLFWQCDMRLS